jgi:uncharacterized protein
MMAPDLDLARRYIHTQPPPGRLILCAVTGAHMYGFPSPDSDLDLKGMHLLPTEQLLGLRPNTDAHDITAVHEGVECDLTTNEIGRSLALLLNGNGNMLERILSPLQVIRSTELDELQGLAQSAICKRFARHYGGFFKGCRREHEREPTAKTMLYSYRAALTGIHLMNTGELEPNLATLGPEYGFRDVADLIALKAAGTEHGALPADLDAHHRNRWPALQDALDRAEANTTLSAEATNTGDIERWLVAARLVDLDRRT